MLKSKIKHKRQDPDDPWVKHPPGSANKDRYPEGFDKLKNAALTNPYIFIWDLYWCIKGDHDLDVLINKWWNSIYTKEFPEEGGCLLELVEKIFNRLIDVGHETAGIEPEEKDYVLPLDSILSELDTKQNKHISKTFLEEEFTMAKAPKKSVAKKKAAPKKTAVKKTAAKKTVEKKTTTTETDNDAPKWVTSGKPGTKAYDSKVLICKLLMERKHTDTEICLMVDSELDYKVSEDRVNFYRHTLNKGRFAPLGFKAPKDPVEQIGGDDSPAPAKKASKKAPMKKTGVQGKNVSGAVKLKLKLKKKKK